MTLSPPLFLHHFVQTNEIVMATTRLHTSCFYDTNVSLVGFRRLDGEQCWKRSLGSTEVERSPPTCIVCFIHAIMVRPKTTGPWIKLLILDSHVCKRSV